jgi:hypothetical protein
MAVHPIRLSWLDLHGKLARWNFEGLPTEAVNGRPKKVVSTGPGRGRQLSPFSIRDGCRCGNQLAAKTHYPRTHAELLPES